jgi:AdoMet-dependent rRNA methyltransferase SPB1
VDLCAAPGGWMQVARQNMPVSSIVIGIDLFPIKPIAGCISLVEDITTDKCKQSLTKELKTWKVDLVLNDGAPNVGKNWLFDAYAQICLSLSAVKLATDFLRPNGWFVTKVFRSKDYNAFVWVLKQLFKKVYATKPSASRKESAEIFVVCQGYKAPTKIDPRFLDPKYVFEELEIEPKNKVDLLKEPKSDKKPKAVGYDSIDVRKIYTATEFLQAESALDILQLATEIKIDDAKIEKHPATTYEIKECFKDIKVLNRKDLKDIIKWWKVVKEAFYPSTKEEEPSTSEAPKKLTEDEQEELELAEIDKHIENLEMEERRDEKRKKKKSNKERTKLEQKLSLKMIIKGDQGPQEIHDEEVFNLDEIKNSKVMDKLLDGVDITKKRDRKKKSQSKVVAYDEDELHNDAAHLPTINSDVEESDSDEEEEELKFEESGSEEEEIDDEDVDDQWAIHPKNGKKENAKKSKRGGVLEKGKNPLITDLDHRDKDAKTLAKAQLWYDKDVFKNKNDEKEEDFDLDTMVKEYKQKGVKVQGKFLI